jgi:hypothetical protein
MQDSENNKPEKIETSAPSIGPSQPLINPRIGLREITATYEMLVNFKTAILSVDWPGEFVQAVAMGLEMVKTMETQSRGQVEMARQNEEEMKRRAKEAIKQQGGTINGQPANPEPAPVH